jgi:hypothetical protein
MLAPTITPERPWPCRPFPPRRGRPLAARMAGLARRAARRLRAGLEDRMLRDLDLGWDTAERGGAVGRA